MSSAEPTDVAPAPLSTTRTRVYVSGDVKCPRCGTKLAGFDQWMESSDDLQIGTVVPLELSYTGACYNAGYPGSGRYCWGPGTIITGTITAIQY